MYPELWGRYGWHLLHTIAQHCNVKNCIEKNVDHFYNFFKSLKTMLPCFKCQEHYKSLMSHNSLRLRKYMKHNRKNIIEWVYDLHENVNRDLNKNKFPLKRVIKTYEKIDHDEIFKFIEISIYELPAKLCMTDIQNIQLFFTSLQNIFPCDGCRIRLKRIVKDHPLTDIYTKEDMIEWYKNIKEKWEDKHASPRNLLLIQFKNKQDQYIQPISIRNVEHVGKYYYTDNGKLYVELEGRGKKKTVRILPKVEFQKEHEISNISLKRKIDMEFLIGYQSIAKKYNNELKVSEHHKVMNDIKYYIVNV
jgi:hypothetical protein